MTTKEYLLQIKKLDAIIENRAAEIDRLRGIAQCVKGISYDRDRVQASGDNQLERVVTMIVDLDRQLNNYIDIKYKIIKQIEALDADEYIVIYLRFVKCCSFDDIHTELNTDDVWSKSKIYHVYRRALESFENKFGELYEGI